MVTVKETIVFTMKAVQGLGEELGGLCAAALCHPGNLTITREISAALSYWSCPGLGAIPEGGASSVS